jgi:hypothetical protein
VAVRVGEIEDAVSFSEAEKPALLTLFLFPLFLLVAGIEHGLAWIRGQPAARSRGFARRARIALYALVGALLGVV